MQDGNLYGVYGLDAYRWAVDSCITKGWLTILTPEHFKREASRRALSPVPKIIDSCYVLGAVDYTEAGHMFHRLLLREILGASILEREYCGFNWNEGRRAFDIYAADERGCRSLLKEIEQDPGGFVGEPVKVA